MSKKKLRNARNLATLGGGALVAASPFVAAGTAHAATITVDSLADDGSGGTTLREAIEQANTNPDADVITFQAGLSGTITLTAPLEVGHSVDIQGPGASVLTVDADGTGMAFYTRDVGAAAEIAISGLKITGGDNSSYAGGISSWGDDVTLEDLVITGNTGSMAGGVYFAGDYDSEGGTLTIRNCDISGNTGTDYAGGVYVSDGGSETAYSLVLIDTTVSGNSGAQYGGALYFDQGTVGDILVANSTISGNTALSGGGIYVEGGDADVYILNSTITGNSATDGYGGGLYLGAAGNNAVIINSVIYGNTASYDGDDIFTQYSSTATANYSLIGEVVGLTLGGANNLSVDPMLGALADNGGMGKTHLPQAGSPLIDAGDPSGVGPTAASYPLTDQRGSARVYNGRIDIGAVEVGAATLPPTGGSNGLMAGLGAGLLALGGALHLTGRRKRTA